MENTKHSVNKFYFLYCFYDMLYLKNLVKLDRVGPVDNRSSTAKLHHFVRKKEEKKITCDTWHVICDTLDFLGGEHSLKISAPYFSLFMIYDITKIWRKRVTELINYLITRLFIEQPRLHRVC